MCSLRQSDWRLVRTWELCEHCWHGESGWWRMKRWGEECRGIRAVDLVCLLSIHKLVSKGSEQDLG